MFEIGNSLREARVRQGLDYSQVELATKIRAKYIRAIEEEEFEVLPSGTYIKGFMRTYADFLGLDGQLYVDEYNSRHVIEGFDDMPQRRPRTRQSRAMERKVVLLGLAGIVALTALVIAAWKYGGGSSNATPPPPVTTLHHTAPTGLAFTGVGQGTYLTVWKRPWLGKPAWQGTLRGGDREFLIGKRFWLSVRHPARVHMTLAGRPVKLPAHRNVRVVVPPKTY